ncbi:phage holin family protein [Stomatohabitans albus]|uniref:phage holin family protein n=1 Tax=Stomatohabitans albus TaxID=3110766 RepID=UPI00300C2328
MADRPGNSRFAPFARLVGHRPEQGAKSAALNVYDEAKALVRAEIALAKAELTAIAQDKAIGAAAFIFAALVAFFGVHALLFFIGAVLALWLPVWAAAGIITLVLFVIALIAAFIGYRQMKIDADPANTRRQFERSTESAQRAVDSMKRNYRAGTREAAHTVSTSVQEAIPENVKNKVPEPIKKVPENVKRVVMSRMQRARTTQSAPPRRQLP